MLNCLLCICMTLALGAGALAAGFFLLAAFFGDRFCDLLGPKTTVRNRMRHRLTGEIPEEPSPHSQQDA